MTGSTRRIGDRIIEILEAVRLEHAPDPRISVFEVGFEVDHQGGVRLEGAISEPAAAEELSRRLALLDGEATIDDRIERLPRADARPHALVTAAIAPLLAGPRVAETHVSQALLGHRLLVLRPRGRWLQCRAGDGYVGWVHRGYLRRVQEAEARAWEIGASGEAALSLGAELLAADGQVVARLPWGARLQLGDDGAAILPDGARGRLRGEVVPLHRREALFPPEGGAVVRTALRWLGAPYLWGGTTPAGVDCSGLTQAVFRTHGVELPRDSDQQALVGEPVAPDPDFSDLLPGDLLFFAEEPDRITHVTISAGGPDIIHSSLGNGGVERNLLTGALHYEEELRRLFVCARRIVG